MVERSTRSLSPARYGAEHERVGGEFSIGVEGGNGAGKLTPQEQAQVNNQLNRESRQIHSAMQGGGGRRR